MHHCNSPGLGAALLSTRVAEPARHHQHVGTGTDRQAGGGVPQIARRDRRKRGSAFMARLKHPRATNSGCWGLNGLPFARVDNNSSTKPKTAVEVEVAPPKGGLRRVQ
jgi:hypothetical protein